MRGRRRGGGHSAGGAKKNNTLTRNSKILLGKQKFSAKKLFRGVFSFRRRSKNFIKITPSSRILILKLVLLSKQHIHDDKFWNSSLSGLFLRINSSYIQNHNEA